MSAASGTTIAGLPQYVVLKEVDDDGHYLQYLWSSFVFGGYYKCMGTNKDVNPVSQFVQLEVVPSTTDPTSFVHLRCCYNNMFLQVVATKEMVGVSATAEAPVEDRDEDTCTLFQPVITGTNTVHLVSLQNKHGGTLWAYDPGYGALLSGVLVASKSYVTEFQFARWVPFEEEKAAADKVAQALKDQVSALEAAAEEREAELAAEESNVVAQVAAAWKAFKANTAA